jgi:metallo-beta-lactamase family protein
MGDQFKFRVDIFSEHENVTGSCTQVTIHMPDGKVKFLIDCGLYQGDEYAKEGEKVSSELRNRAPFSFEPEDIQFVLVTHNHTDHVGRLPLLYKRGYTGLIHTTKDTSKMLSLSLGDSEKVLKMNADENGFSQLYAMSDVRTTLENVASHDFEKWFEPYPGIKVIFFMNGHLIGSALTFIHISAPGCEPIDILAMGDYKANNAFFAVRELPFWVSKIPINIITESTYGHIDSTEAERPVFANNIIELLETKNLILIPVFSLARGQEIMYELKKLQESGRLSKDIPIYADGRLFIDYCNMYKYRLNISENMKDFYPANLNFMNKEIRDVIIKSHMKKIILTTSGMANHGPAQEYIPKIIERKDSAIHFVGYTAPTTLGYHLINAKEGEIVQIGDVPKKKKCEVRTTGEFSTHAKRDELLDFLKQFDNINSLLIQHGEMAVKEKFSEYCKQNLDNCKRIEILGNGNTVCLSSWKIEKVSKNVN